MHSIRVRDAVFRQAAACNVTAVLSRWRVLQSNHFRGASHGLYANAAETRRNLPLQTHLRTFHRERQHPHTNIRSLSSVTSSPNLILESWAADIPHPDKVDRGGEDAHFILNRSPVDGSSSVGVADGVGGWASSGIDAGEYSRALMAVVKMRLESDASPPCPVDALSVAARAVKKVGSSTACVAVLHESKLHTLNLGDSGFILLRPKMLEDNAVKYELQHQSKEQTHGFNFPFQLGDDVLVMGTDGVWDNLFPDFVIERVQECHEGHELERAASRIAQEAAKAGSSPDWSPFTERAWQEHRLIPIKVQASRDDPERDVGRDYPGGKLDDVTVIVARVVKAPEGDSTFLL